MFCKILVVVLCLAYSHPVQSNHRDIEQLAGEGASPFSKFAQKLASFISLRALHQGVEVQSSFLAALETRQDEVKT